MSRKAVPLWFATRVLTWDDGSAPPAHWAIIQREKHRHSLAVKLPTTHLRLRTWLTDRRPRVGGGRRVAIFGWHPSKRGVLRPNCRAVYARRLPWPTAGYTAATSGHASVFARHKISDVGDPTGVVYQPIEARVGAKHGNSIAKALLHILQLRVVRARHHRLRLLRGDAEGLPWQWIIRVNLSIKNFHLRRAYGTADDKVALKIKHIAVQLRHCQKWPRAALACALPLF